MGLRQKFRFIFRILWFFIWTYPIRLYRPIKKLFIFFLHVTNYRHWKRQIWEDLFGIALLVADLFAIPEIYDIANLIVKRETRGLTPKEKELCRLMLKGRDTPDLIKIDATAFTAKKRNIAYVSFFTINVYGGSIDYKLRDKIFVHELIHVWQYTRFGSEYISRALFAQHSHEGYDYGGATGITEAYVGGKSIMDFNFEQQGDILADYFMNIQQRDRITSSSFFQRNQVYEHFVDEIRTMKVYRW